MITESEYRSVFAKRLRFLRKQCNMTQYDLAQFINYSDKAVSKWERGESVPDTYTLLKLAELFGITVDEFFNDKVDLPSIKINKFNPSRLFVPLITAVGVLFLASVAFLIMVNVPAWASYSYFPFLYATPVVAIIITVFSSLWWKYRYKCISVSSIIWSSAIAVYFTFEIENLKYIFIPCAILQIICVLIYLFVYYFRKINRKEG